MVSANSGIPSISFYTSSLFHNLTDCNSSRFDKCFFDAMWFSIFCD